MKTPVESKPAGLKANLADPSIAPQPYAVKLLNFVSPTSGPGFSVQTALSVKSNGRPSRHRIEYMPWVRAFRVTYTTDDGTVTGYIPEHRVSCWYPAD